METIKNTKHTKHSVHFEQNGRGRLVGRVKKKDRKMLILNSKRGTVTTQ